MAVIHFNEAGLQKALAQGALILVDFWADWCGPCQRLAPVIEALAEKFDGRLAVGKVNVDEEQKLAEQYGVMSIPTVILFQNGAEVERSVGLAPQSSLEERIRAHL